MQTVVGVRFKRAGKIYYFDPQKLALATDDGVIVETSWGLEFGRVVIGPRQVQSEEIASPLKPVLRQATRADLHQVGRNKERERRAFDIGKEKIEKHKLPMKLINVEYTFDMSKIIFFFTADGRVDFRELVRDLAAVFHTRIELRQVGVRDEAKELNGIGPCGRAFCCATFLQEFAAVSIKMAKNQGLSLNPTKVSGACGRLMCCLRYENDSYKKGGDLCKDCTCPHKKEAQERLAPRVGKEVDTPAGRGKVQNVNTNKRTALIQMPDERRLEWSWQELTEVREERREGADSAKQARPRNERESKAPAREERREGRSGRGRRRENRREGRGARENGRRDD